METGRHQLLQPSRFLHLKHVGILSAVGGSLGQQVALRSEVMQIISGLCACFMHLHALCFRAVCSFVTAAEMQVSRESVATCKVCCLLEMNITNCYFQKEHV